MMTPEEYFRSLHFRPYKEAVEILNAAFAERYGRDFSVVGFPFNALYTQNALCNIQGIVSKLARRFLIDPGQINFQSIVQNTIECHNLQTLADAANQPLILFRRAPVDFSFWRIYFPYTRRGEDLNFEYSRFLPRLPAEFFFNMAKLLQPMRYLALPMSDRMIVPSSVRAGTITRIFCIFYDNSDLPRAETVICEEIHNGYLAPGEYSDNDWDIDMHRDLQHKYCGYIDLVGNFEYFGGSSTEGENE